MRNNYTLSQMPTIDFDLSNHLNSEIENAINLLQYSDLKTDEAFNKVLNQLQQKVDLKPVEFSEPEITGYRKIEKEVPSNYYSPMGGKRQIYVISVKIGFKGSERLFQYKPNGFSFSSSDIPVIQQPSGDAIYLEIEHSDLSDREGVLKEVQSHMNITYSTIISNNRFIEGWKAGMKSSIEQRLLKHKNDLGSLFGN